MVPCMPPESSIGYWFTMLSERFTKFSLMAEIDPPVFVLRLDQPRFQAGDDRVVPVLADVVTDLLGLGTVDEILLQPPHHLLHVGVERLLGAVVVD